MNEGPRSTRSLSFASVAVAALLLGACGASTPNTARPTSAVSATTSARPSASAVATTAAVTAATTPAPSAASAATAPAASAPAATAAASDSASSAPAAAPAASSAPTVATPAPAPIATPAPAVQASSSVAVTLVDVGVKLDRTSVGSGPVTFAIKNSGSVIHELVLLKTDVPQDQIPVDPSKPGMVSQPGFLGQTGTLAPGATTTLSLTLASGKYVLLCNQPAHYLIGMHTGFTVN
jgi:uncharacterized cupredoxin-like copper-binding protein